MSYSEDARRASPLGRLARQIEDAAPHDGVFPLRIPDVYAIRRSTTRGQQQYSTMRPSICLVAQGAKTLWLGRETIEYDSSRMLVFSVDLPVSTHVVKASRTEPFLCFGLELDARRLAGLVPRVFPRGVPEPERAVGLCITPPAAALIDSASRLLETLHDSTEADLLGPLILDEILIRLLRSPIGPRLAQVGGTDAGVQRIARAISELRDRFAQPISVRHLADVARMSLSSFYEHFRAATTMTPLQYQKVLRLHEAKRLMLTGSVTAKEAALAVGYLSASQFSREYGRYFGATPTRDTARLRASVSPVVRNGDLVAY